MSSKKPKTETIEEYLARGGKITYCEPGEFDPVFNKRHQWNKYPYRSTPKKKSPSKLSSIWYRPKNPNRTSH